MRIALLADIHGNSIALDAVLNDIAARGDVDAYGLLGDYCAIGPDPVGVLERLARLPVHFCVRGNADRFLTTSSYPEPTIADVQRDPSLARILAEIHSGFGWTQGAITATGWFDWLDDLPLEHRETLSHGTRLLAVHAAPGRDDNPALEHNMSDEDAAALIANCAADLVLTGHTHVAHDRIVENVRLVNPGSVSNPKAPDLRAKYAVLHIGNDDYRVEQRYVDYDHGAVVEHLREMHHPSPDYIVRFMRGEIS